MPLNLEKLNSLLTSKGFLIRKYYIMDGMCFFIELLSMSTSDILLLYIPSKYNFNISTKQGNNIYKIKYIYLDDNENGNEEKDYQDIGQNLSPTKENIENHLENNYKKPIDLQDISINDIQVLKSINRQLKRLRYCVQNIKYKLGIAYMNYICAIRRDNTINCFAVKHLPRIDCKRLMIIVDLETLYEKNDKLLEDIYIVRNSIYNVLERNQGMHTKVVDKMIENRKDMLLIPEQFEIKKQQYDSMIGELEQLLATLLNSEEPILKQLAELDKNNQISHIHSDIEKAHKRSQLNKELDKINSMKGEISKYIFYLRSKKENAALEIDKIMFDNTLMFDSMIRNFANLKEFC